ncbi:hypothetical protein [Actinomadura rubrisoli]|uniref:Uncharacterized protein n=1 Tax=Actinomadura rubrisoli TaxID=2530368 RepID=A0A4R5CB39_9ACTN|nr:hypothetical protein [Actinomadura rubrisoli]TDD97158.1 hypothetical protein E1298_01605 [Actinomadura rubrisoli]
MDKEEAIRRSRASLERRNLERLARLEGEPRYHRIMSEAVKLNPHKLDELEESRRAADYSTEPGLKTSEVVQGWEDHNYG